MYYLDANAFYWYYGRKNLGMNTDDNVDEEKLKFFMNSIDMKSIPASVYIEIITHFRNNPNIINSILNFISEKNIKIARNYSQCFLLKNEKNIVNENDYISILSYAELKTRNKIEIEKSFAVSFFEITALLYLQFKENNSNLSDEQKNVLTNHIGNDFCKSTLNNYISKFRNIISEGYKIGKEAQELKKFYTLSLTEVCVYINAMIALVYNYNNRDIDLIETIKKEYAKLSSQGVELDKTDSDTMNYISRELQSDSTFLEYSRKRIANIFQNKLFTKNQCKYINEIMMEAWFNRGQRLRKNDIFDMLCVGVLDNKNMYLTEINCLISFDKTMLKYLEQHSKYSYEKSISFYK